jgi:hypothetical protein
LSIRLEPTMLVKTGAVLVTRPLSVCCAMNYESLALKKYDRGYPPSDVLVPRDTHLQRFLESTDGQVPLSWQRKTIQYP